MTGVSECSQQRGSLKSIRYMLTVLGGLIAYCLKWKKPSLKVFYSEDDFSVTV
ncbi:hypothetical protein GPY23_06840 [Photorhabdus bodei]|uniref:Transposase n=1 Tax=Photorhabdus bodei TaxID=2029681 RepID=A0ABX0ASU5_9GAMM|nr:hypothetical protein [Photorhabdus bodei]NDK98730.1 hypothetical protein [Photorhabdus bodei]NDL03674.1 hypothetical protein [Photorhabdus bodei]NDL07188.1 hypothetical protein [Photorhabdus bodei]